MKKSTEKKYQNKKSVQHRNSDLLTQFAEAKNLPVSYLEEIGIKEIKNDREKKLRFTCRDQNGREIATRFLTMQEGDDTYEWKKGSTACFYGLDKLREAKEKKYIILVQKESECQILWYKKIPALCIPDGKKWNDAKDAEYFIGIKKIYLLKREDNSADDIINQLSNSSLKEKIKVLELEKYKNLNELFAKKPNTFKEYIKLHRKSSSSLQDYIKDRNAKIRKHLYKKVKEIAEADDILKLFSADIREKGMVREKRLTQGIYLSLVTSLLGNLVNVAIKGDSSSGKSYAVKSVLKYFPPEVYYELTSATEKGLIYSQEDFKNRFIIIAEAVGLHGTFLDYIIRSLISEKAIQHQTKNGLLKKEGPTGFITTTTSDSLNNGENETRYLSLYSDSSPKQTKAVLMAKAKIAENGSSNMVYNWDRWQDFQRWLATKRNEYVIPYSRPLGKLLPDSAPRLRRDIDNIHGLIGAHAIIHQKNREKNSNKYIVANKDDYKAIYKILAKPLSETFAAKNSDIAMVEAVRSGLETLDKDSISMTELASIVKLDKGTVSRNIRSAIDKGYLINCEKKKGMPAKLILGRPVGESLKILPSPKELWKAYKKKK